MLAVMAHEPDEVAADEWVSFPGGELEGRRPRALCAACREALRRASLRGSAAPRDQRRARTLCFGCYRAELDRQKAIAARDRKSTRLNSSHLVISYAVFCLKQKGQQLPLTVVTSDLPRV